MKPLTSWMWLSYSSLAAMFFLTVFSILGPFSLPLSQMLLWLRKGQQALYLLWVTDEETSREIVRPGLIIEIGKCYITSFSRSVHDMMDAIDIWIELSWSAVTWWHDTHQGNLSHRGPCKSEASPTTSRRRQGRTSSSPLVAPCRFPAVHVVGRAISISNLPSIGMQAKNVAKVGLI